MCGISGIIGQDWKPQQLEAMVQIQHHRGPDSNGSFVSADQQAGLGHNRLKIIDLTDAGHQPMPSACGNKHIVFNGEIYNYVELRKELSSYPYQSESDTEVILAAYEKWGAACVEHFIGMFAFAIWDSQTHELFAARDRLGIKPFHFAWLDDCFVFASEIKAILAAGVDARPNQETWATYLTHGYYDHSDSTFFDGIECLPAGHTLTLRHQQPRIQSYWNLAEIAQQPVDATEAEISQQFTELFDDAVRIRLRSDVPIGVNLSGGLDSASLMATVDHIHQDAQSLETFTASFEEPKYDEREFANEIPRRNHWNRHFNRLRPEQIPALAEKLQWHEEAPYGGISTIAYFALHGLAAERNVTVLLEGQGVDEMLAGYAYFQPAHLWDLLGQGLKSRLRGELRHARAAGQSPFTAMRQHARQVTATYQDGSSHLNAGCVNPDVRSIAGPSPEFPRPFDSQLQNVLYRDLRFTKLPRVLRFNDRLSMAFSRELRETYLDHRIVEFLFQLPASFKIRDGQTKYLLRQAMRQRLPDNIRKTPKRPVVTPQREWMRGPLKSYVGDIIHSGDFAERGLFDADMCRTEFDKFCNGHGDNAFFVWQWVNSELWFRMFTEPARAMLST